MAISYDLTDNEVKKFKETSVPGQPGVVVVSADGSNVGASTADGSTVTPGTTAGGLIEGIYEASPTTVADGKAGIVGIDATRNQKVREQYQPAYEDNTKGVAKVEQRFSYSAVATADVQVLGAAGFLHSVTFSCNDAAPTAGSIIIYDSLTETGTQLFNHTFTTTPFVPFTVTFDVSVGTGIYVGFTTTNDVNVTCAFRS